MGSLFGGPKAPAPPPPTPVMPIADDASVQAAKKKKLSEIASRQGRASTILTQDNGFSSPTSQTLG